MEGFTGLGAQAFPGLGLGFRAGFGGLGPR